VMTSVCLSKLLRRLKNADRCECTAALHTTTQTDTAMKGAVQDSKRYNEWMNIVDYETPEGDREHEQYREELRRKGLSPVQLLARKRKASRQVTGTGKMNAEVCRMTHFPFASSHLLHCNSDALPQDQNSA
jgi:hypothetical protein